MTNSMIRSIVWDVGGVLIRTEDPAPRLALARQYNMTRMELEALVFGEGDRVPGQLGQITFEEHLTELAQQLHLNAEEMNGFMQQFFAGDMVDLHLVDEIRQMKTVYQTAILSNAFSNLRELLAHEWQIADGFDQIVVSAEVGLMKPDPKIFDELLKVTGEKAESTVFIDDSPANVQAARSCGIEAIRFVTPDQVMQELENKLHVLW